MIKSNMEPEGRKEDAANSVVSNSIRKDFIRGIQGTRRSILELEFISQNAKLMTREDKEEIFALLKKVIKETKEVSEIVGR